MEAHRDRALDPLSSGEEAARAREALTAAQFTRDRLNTALPRLRVALKQARAAEQAGRWAAEYERVEAERDEVARELAQTYPAMLAHLIDLFRRVREVDEELNVINRNAPRGERRRLQRVERHALGLPNDMWDTSPIIERVQLPEWSGNREMAWPPYRPPVLPATCFPGFYPPVPWTRQREEDVRPKS